MTPRVRTIGGLLALLVPVVLVMVSLGPGSLAGDTVDEHAAGEPEHTDAPSSGDPGHGSMVEPSHDMRSVFPKVEDIYDSLTEGGLTVEFTVTSADEFFGPKNVETGGLATVKLRITDAVGGTARANVLPRAWIDAVADGAATTDEQCASRVAAHARGGIAERALVDLNSFFVLVLNQTPTISVIDPLVSLAGMTQLYAMLELPGPAADWDLSADGQLLLVTSPSAGAVSVASTASFRVAGTVKVGGLPVHVRMEPNGRYAWVTNDSGPNGLAVVDTQELAVVATIPTGQGHHELALSRDGSRVYVSSRSPATVAIVDTARRKTVATASIEPDPAALAVSPRDGTIWVADAASASVQVLDPETLKPVRETGGLAGATVLRFTPDGAWAVLASPLTNELLVLDAMGLSAPRVVSLSGGPDEIVFSGAAAYVHLRDRAVVGSVRLSDLEQGRQLRVTEIAYGERAPSGVAAPVAAAPMAATPGEAGLLIADPAGGQVSYYLEGASKPAGALQNYDRTPLAVGVVNRGFTQEAPGIYSARFRVPESGSFDVAVLLDSPRIVHCFRFTAREDSAAGPTPRPAPDLAVVGPTPTFVAGQEGHLRVRLADKGTGAPISGVRDLVVLVGHLASNWSVRVAATSLGGGEYEVALTLPRAGAYGVAFSATSLGAGLEDLPQLLLEATPN